MGWQGGFDLKVNNFHRAYKAPPFYGAFLVSKGQRTGIGPGLLS
ncbi:hypothetical protein SAMN05444277_11478 [Parafilimonas terrae]|jgi:hypothetical protein|uniref:Uncharacterized protein n=1 Tax=Parafilimonas terrae TaxID=1465490 RepID=A0A1I5YVI2_9BACT|nr:hypothetical protein SAMN05444277_11478 [Parafilimonas terrae]